MKTAAKHLLLMLLLALAVSKTGDLSAEKKRFLIDKADHRIGGNLLFDDVFVGLV